MIMLKGNIYTVQGSPTHLTAELGGVMVGVWQAIRQQLHDDQLALGMFVRLIMSVIEYEKISTTEILEAIRTVEEVENVHG